MSKRFNDYTDAELLGIDNDTLNISIRVEAIQRGVKPPITLSDALKQSEWRGYQKPGNAIRVWTIDGGGWASSSFGWLDEAKATAAIEGAVRLGTTYRNNRELDKIETGSLSLKVVFIGDSESVEKAAAFEAAMDDDESKEFEALRDECIARYSRVRQEAYDARVRTEKRAEYLRLAGGDEAIAKAFWARVEGGEWPEA